MGRFSGGRQQRWVQAIAPWTEQGGQFGERIKCRNPRSHRLRQVGARTQRQAQIADTQTRTGTHACFTSTQTALHPTALP